MVMRPLVIINLKNTGIDFLKVKFGNATTSTDAVKQYKQNINKGMNAAVENAYKKPQSARKSSRDLKAIQSKLDRNSKADQ